MPILITGASSYVGAKIYSDLKEDYPEVIGTYNSNRLFPELVRLDITDKDQVIRIVEKVKPSIIIHVAANPSGSWCRKNQDEAVAINEAGTRNIVDAANNVSAKIIYISSFVAINPTTLYGRTKLAGEESVKKTKTGYVILRPSLIIGYSPNITNDRPFNRILKNITDNTPAVYDTSWKFQPTWLKHISEVIQGVMQKGITDETIPVSVPELRSRFDIANDILAEFDIKAVPKDENDPSPIFSESLDRLEELGLPQYTYPEIISGIIEEIKQHTSGA